MTATEITLIISSVTAFFAIIVPVITAHISTRSAERMKQIELRDPLAFEALSEFTKSYSDLHSVPEAYSYLQSKDGWEINAGYRSFIKACHKLLPLVPDSSLQHELCQFMQAILSNGKTTNRSIDQQFDQLTIRLGAALIHSHKEIKKNRKNTV